MVEATGQGAWGRGRRAASPSGTPGALCKDGGQLSLSLSPVSPLQIRKNLEERFLITDLGSGLRGFGPIVHVGMPGVLLYRGGPRIRWAGGFPERPWRWRRSPAQETPRG